MRVAIVVLAFLLLLVPLAQAHYHVVIPDKAAPKKGEAVSVVVFYGHPYEHDPVAADRPEAFALLHPDGETRTPVPSVEDMEIVGASGEAVKGWRFTFTPVERGDYHILIEGALMFDGTHVVQDSVKVPLHVQAERGWDKPCGQPAEWRPLIRPYGLEAGFVFRAQALLHGQGVPFARFEIERYHPRPPRSEDLPDETLMTRSGLTDGQGVAAFTLDEPGWWNFTFEARDKTIERDGEAFPLLRRGTIWLFVEPPFTQELR